jgi:toxin ParE1/3/4
MSFGIIIRPKAEQDILEAYEWYEKQLAGLGSGFLEQVGLVLDLIQEIPTMFPAIFRKARRGLLKKFPYGIFYIFDGTLVTVVAVMHFSREPNFWTNRPTG